MNKKLSLLVLTTIALLGACDFTPVPQIIHWEGFWYDSEAPLTRGAFIADLTIKYDVDAEGTVTLENHPLGTFAVSGKAGWEMGGGYSYSTIDLHNEEQTAVIELIVFMDSLHNDAHMYGILEYGGETRSVYTIPSSMQILTPTSGYKVALAEMGALTVKPNTPNEVWAYGKVNESDPDYSYFEITDGSGAVSLIGFDPDGSGLAWHDDQLWFVEEVAMNDFNLHAYNDADYSLVSTVALEDGGGFFFGISGISFTSGGELCTVSGMVVHYVDYFNPATGVKTGQMTGSYSDLYAPCPHGTNMLFLQVDRIGHLEPVLSYTLPGTLNGQYAVPMANAVCLATDNTDLFIGYRSGWILKVPLSQLTP